MYDTIMKRHLRPRCTPFEGAEGAVLPPCLHSPASPVHIILHALSLLVIVGYSLSL